MFLIPAIDIKDGKCVRLFQGDYDQVTVFSDDPVQMARRWLNEGSAFLHVVDLDGAREGASRNLEVIRDIVESVDMPVEVGGGLRSIDAIRAVLEAGVIRAILGTVAVTDRALVKEACRLFGERIAVGLDARDGMVATEGWTQTSSFKALDLARELVQIGVPRFIYTDIRRDGTLTEPNYDALREMVEGVGVPVIASGGVSSPEHLDKLAEIGVEAAIAGKALYTGDLKLRDVRRYLATDND